jgi:hypothetical protein
MICPDFLDVCYISNWPVILEAFVVSLCFGLVIGAAVGLVVNVNVKK